MPLNSSTGTNDLGTVLSITNGSPFDGNCSVLTWNGAGFNYRAFDSGYGGWIDQNYNPASAPVVNPGQAFFFSSGIASNNVTIAGAVAAISLASGGTPVTNTLTSGYTMVGSIIPMGGSLTDTNINLPTVSNDGNFSILQWDTKNNKYIYSAYDSGYGGWIDQNYQPISAPVLNVGQGFFYNNGNVSTPWVQTLQ